MSAVRKYEKSYYDGNTVRKINAVPEYDPRREERREEYERRRKEERKAKQRRLARHRGIDKVSLLFFSGALALTLYTGVGYLQAQQKVRILDKSVTALQKEVISIKDENGAISDSANSVDLDYIKDYAMNTLGMVYPEDNEVITYDQAKKDYVKQYADIPNGESSDLLDSIKNK